MDSRGQAKALRTSALDFGLIGAAAAQTGGPDTQISLAYSVAPSVFQIGQNPNVLFSLTNQNPNAAQQLQPGNTFTFTLGVPGSSINAAGASAVVNSSTFRNSDFQPSLGPNPNQLTLTYIGPPQTLPVGDTISVEATVSVSQVASGSVTLQVPSTGFDSPATEPLNASAVDFPVAPTGPAGPNRIAGLTGTFRAARPAWPDGPTGHDWTTRRNWTRWPGGGNKVSPAHLVRRDRLVP